MAAFKTTAIDHSAIPPRQKISPEFDASLLKRD
jgi:hypothetical protein